MFYSAPDIYYAAAVMKVCGFSIGGGDRRSVYGMLRKGTGYLPAAKDKL